MKKTWTDVAGAVLALILVCVGVAIIVCGVSLLVAVPFYLLWNYVAPDLGWPQLAFFKSWALFALIGIIGAAFKTTIKHVKKVD